MERENDSLRNAAPEVDVDSKVSTDALRTVEARCQLLEKRYLDAYQDNLGLNAAIKKTEQNLQEYVLMSLQGLTEEADVIRSRPYLELRDRFQAKEAAYETAERHMSDLEGQLSDLRMRLANTTQSSPDDNENAQSKNARREAGPAIEIWEAERSRLTDRAKNFEFEMSNYRSLLRHALLDIYSHLKDDTELRSKNEFRLVSEQLSTFKTKSSPTEEELALSIAGRVESSLEEVKKAENEAAQVRAGLESSIEALKDKLKRAEEEIAKGVKVSCRCFRSETELVIR